MRNHASHHRANPCKVYNGVKPYIPHNIAKLCMLCLRYETVQLVQMVQNRRYRVMIQNHTKPCIQCKQGNTIQSIHTLWNVHACLDANNVNNVTIASSETGTNGANNAINANKTNNTNNATSANNYTSSANTAIRACSAMHAYDNANNTM